MQNYKLILEYNGTHYNGWQVQSNGTTVQGKVEEACKKIFKQKVRVVGSGRTDSGVHALGQVASFKVATSMNVDKIKNALNANLPKDISVLNVQKVSDQFHAQFSAKSKTYRYTILNRDAKPALNNSFCFHYPYKLDLKRMKEEARSLKGEHDFKSFQAADLARKDKSTIRTIKRLDIKRNGDSITIDVEANGFLYKMARNIAGTLIKAGNGKLEKGEIKRILAKKDRNKAAATAKACGLSLLEVKY